MRIRNGLVAAITLSVAIGIASANAALVGKWTFNEGSGTTAHDSSGNGNDGTLTGGATYVPAPGGYAVSLDGVSGMVTINTNNLFNFSGPFTIEVWVLKTGPESAGESGVFGKDYVSYGISSYHPSPVVDGFYIAYGNGGGNSVNTGTRVTNQWSHIVETFDGIDTIEMWWNGVSMGTKNVGTNTIPASGNPLIIGGPSIWGSYLRGLVDQAAIYDTKLSNSEISSNFASGPTPYSGLIGKWIFNEGSGTIAHDSSGFGNDGTLTGGATWATNGTAVGVSLDGVNGMVTINTNNLFNFSGPFTLGVWVMKLGPESLGEACVFGKDYVSYGISSYHPSPSSDGFYLIYGNGGGNYVNTGLRPTNAWSYMVETYDGTNTIEMWWNGISQGTKVVGAIPATGNPLIVGGPGNWGSYLHGLVNEAAIYNVKLSNSQIASNYASGPTLPSGLIGKWTFNEGSGTIAHDSSGFGNDGTLSGGATWVSSPGGYAVALDGLSGMVTLGPSSGPETFNLPGAFTLEVWVEKTGSQIGESAVFGKDQYSYAISSYAGDQAYYGYVGNGGQHMNTGPVPTNEWDYLVLTYDGLNKLTLFRNGNLEGTNTVAAGVPVSWNPLLVGSDASANFDYFHGLVDQAAIYNGVLSNSEITAHYLAGPVGSTSTEGNWTNHYGVALNTTDADGDGVNNLTEFQTGFNPNSSAAYAHIVSIVKVAPDINITYLGASGDSTYTGGPTSRTNVLEFSTGESNGSFSNNFASTGITNIMSGGAGLGTSITVTDSGGANGSTRYYRVKVLAP
jgi:hypothetical protein